MTAITWTIIIVVWVGFIWFLLRAGKWKAKIDEDYDKIYENELREKQMTDFRTKFIENNLKICTKSYLSLTAWEQSFVDNIEKKIKYGKKLSRKQYNTLNEIAQKYKKTVTAEDENRSLNELKQKSEGQE